MVPDVPTAVVETEAFLAVVRKLMDEKDREDLIDFLAWNPVVGDIIAGTGGIRKGAVGFEGARQTRRCAGDLLLSR